jgi:hypothetical protein
MGKPINFSFHSESKGPKLNNDSPIYSAQKEFQIIQFYSILFNFQTMTS